MENEFLVSHLEGRDSENYLVLHNQQRGKPVGIVLDYDSMMKLFQKINELERKIEQLEGRPVCCCSDN